jgi:hypothetical protein
MPLQRRCTARKRAKMRHEISTVANQIQVFRARKLSELPTWLAQISSAAGNNYAGFGRGRHERMFYVQIHADGFIARAVCSLRGD